MSSEMKYPKYRSLRVYLLSMLCIVCTYASRVYAQESCFEQYLRENNMTMLTAEDADDSYDELKKDVFARQVLQEEKLFQPVLLAIDTIIGTCHLLAQDGTILADVHLTMVDSTWYMWLSVDPFADKYPNLTPYIYCENNPVMIIDDQGDSTRLWVETIGVGHT